MKRCVPLEPQAEAVCQASSKPPLIFELPVAQGRMVLEEAHDSPVYKYPARAKRVVVNTGRWGAIPVYLVEPETVCTPANVILYIHGAGWVFGSYHTHEKLVRELAARTGSLLIFPEYSRSPEVRYPTAIEQCYSVMCMVPELVRNMGYTANPDTFTVAGDSVGGNMATALTLMSKFRRGPAIQKQLLYYPVTNACFNTGSYCEFAQGYYLYRAGMEWFWNQYTMSQKDRNQITASPLRANLEQLRGLPDTMILNGEADVLRDEGEAYAIKLRQAGVDVTAVRFQAIIHDFVMLNSLDQTKACRAAMDVSTEWINRKNVEKQ
ncbi:alpha/beta hydrolase [Enterocloster citroniae]|uniref:alpha/beta hydrolase n=1 Tax=Enterocloster citroniae TaxID=358743 RepID=UPI00349EF881